MFIIEGKSGTLSAVVATSSVQKAAFHFKQMTRSGLHPVISTSEGHIFSAKAEMPSQSSTSPELRAFH